VAGPRGRCGEETRRTCIRQCLAGATLDAGHCLVRAIPGAGLWTSLLAASRDAGRAAERRLPRCDDALSRPVSHGLVQINVPMDPASSPSARSKGRCRWVACHLDTALTIDRWRRPFNVMALPRFDREGHASRRSACAGGSGLIRAMTFGARVEGKGSWCEFTNTIAVNKNRIWIVRMPQL